MNNFPTDFLTALVAYVLNNPDTEVTPCTCGCPYNHYTCFYGDSIVSLLDCGHGVYEVDMDSNDKHTGYVINVH